MFKKKKIKFLGRAGLKFYDAEKVYIINSELLSSKIFDIIIFENDIYYIKNNDKHILLDNERNIIFLKVKSELENMGLKVATSK